MTHTPLCMLLCGACSYEWLMNVIGNDGYDALNRVIEMLASGTITR